MSKQEDRIEGDVPTPAYYPAGSMRIPELGLEDGSMERQGSHVRRMGAAPLVGASVLESVMFTGSHIDACPFDELSKSLLVIEQKLHAGQYDAHVIPLVEAFLGELKTLARIQVDRNGVHDQRINDLKTANVAASDAVGELRRKREEAIEGARKRYLDQIELRAGKRMVLLERKQHEKDIRIDRKARASADRAARREARRQIAEERKRERLESRAQRRRERADKRYRKEEIERTRSELEHERIRCESEAERAEILLKQAQARSEVNAAWRQAQAVLAEAGPAWEGADVPPGLSAEGASESIPDGLEGSGGGSCSCAQDEVTDQRSASDEVGVADEVVIPDAMQGEPLEAVGAEGMEDGSGVIAEVALSETAAVPPSGDALLDVHPVPMPLDAPPAPVLDPVLRSDVPPVPVSRQALRPCIPPAPVPNPLSHSGEGIVREDDAYHGL